MRKYFVILIVFFLIVSAVFLYRHFSYVNVIVKFDKLEPFDKQMNVYFKGFKMGRTVNIYPDKNFQNTYLRLRLNRGKISLPSNSTVQIRKVKSGSYVDIIYPDNPSLRTLKNNDVIKGNITKDINALLEGQFEDEAVNDLVYDTTNLLQNANTTLMSLNSIFVQFNEIIKEIHPDIIVAASSLANASQNLAKATETLNSALESDTAVNTIDNLSSAAENIDNVTQNLNEISSQIHQVTIPMTNSILCQTNNTMSDVSEISSGIKNTLKKRFGFGRLLFGQPVSD